MSKFRLLSRHVKIQYLYVLQQLQKYYSQKEVNNNQALFCQASGIASTLTVLDTQALAILPELFEIYFRCNCIRLLCFSRKNYFELIY